MRTFHSGGVAGSDITQGLPRVEEIFEARTPKKTSIMAEKAGKVYVTLGENNVHELTLVPDDGTENIKIVVPYGTRLVIEDGQHVAVGDGLTEGNKAPADIMRILGLDAVYAYITMETQKVYRSQSCDVNDKHIEIIARQMTRKIRIEKSGDSNFLLGSVVDVIDFMDVRDALQARIDAGEIGLELPEGSTVLLGITKAALQTSSFLSAASFQETTKVLADAAIKGKVDHLVGLKENVIIGKLIPAGTGMDCYHNIDVEENETVGAFGSAE
jgi:DNA-directed RNA polymerase subunit beta'